MSFRMEIPISSLSNTETSLGLSVAEAWEESVLQCPRLFVSDALSKEGKKKKKKGKPN